MTAISLRKNWEFWPLRLGFGVKFATICATWASSQRSVTTTLLVSTTRYSPRAALSPWLIAAGSPRHAIPAITVTGTGAASRTLARYADVSSVEPSSTTISSHGCRVCRPSAAMHGRINSKCQYVGTEGHEGNEEYGNCYRSCCFNTWRPGRRPPPEACSALTLRFLC
jgi:hypothetical protein